MSGVKNDIYMIARSGKAKHLSRFFDVKEVPEMAEEKKNTGNGAAKKDPSQMSRYELIKAGLVEPEGKEKGWANLIPVTERTEEERKEILRKGAEAGREIQKKQRTTKEILERILALPAKERAKECLTPDLVDKLGDDVTQKDVINARMALEAQEGNIKAAVYVRDSIGEKPADVMQVEATVSPEDMALVDRVSRRLKNAQEQDAKEKEMSD